MKVHIRVYATKYIWDSEDASIHILNRKNLAYHLRRGVRISPDEINLIFLQLDLEGEVCLMIA